MSALAALRVSETKSTLAERRWLPWQASFIGAAIHEHVDLLACRGGLGSGKSSALCSLADAICMTRPGAQVVIACDTYTRLAKVHLKLMAELQPAATWNQAARTYTYANSSQISLIHLDTPAGAGQGTSAIEGFNAHAVLIDECQALRPNVLDIAVSRSRVDVADLQGRICPALVVLAGIPCEPCWWVERTREAGGRVFLPTTSENLQHLGANYIERQRQILSTRDFEGLIQNRPTPAVGQIYASWSGKDYPEGNVLRREGWSPDKTKMRMLLSVDFGIRKPAALVFAQDRDLPGEPWIIVKEYAPDNVSTPELGRMIARDCGPRGSGKRFELEVAVGDPFAGRKRSSADLATTEAKMLGQTIGMRIIFPSDPEMLSVRGGIARTDKAIEERRLLLWSEVYDYGIRAPQQQRAIARAITGYRYEENRDEPVKGDGNDDLADCVRYCVCRVLWRDHAMDGRHIIIPTARPSTSPIRAATRALLSGQGRWRRGQA